MRPSSPVPKAAAAFGLAGSRNWPCSHENRPYSIWAGFSLFAMNSSPQRVFRVHQLRAAAKSYVPEQSFRFGRKGCLPSCRLVFPWTYHDHNALPARSFRNEGRAPQARRTRRLTFDNCQSPQTRATELGGVSNFLRLERFALAPKSVGLLRVWIWPCTRAAVASVERQRVPATHTSSRSIVALRANITLPWISLASRGLQNSGGPAGASSSRLSLRTLRFLRSEPIPPRFLSGAR